jgi:CRP-like cAMP-binding protein
MTDKTDVIARLPIFAGLEPRSQDAVAALARVVSRPVGSVLVREGEPADAFYVIVSGTVHIHQKGRFVRSLSAGGFLGEIALVDPGERTATATCATDCELVELGSHEFGRVMASFPDVRGRVEAAATRRSHPDSR